MTTDNYTPPSTLPELMQRYALGERHFPNVDLSEANLSRVTLDGASFGPHSWFSSADFTSASLRGTSFCNCNVKCAMFNGADLTNASFANAAIESISLDGAVLVGTNFVGATFYGITLGPDDQFPREARAFRNFELLI